MLDAYRRAAGQADEAAPRCKGVTWATLAGIGRVESDHLADPKYTISASGDVSPRFVGPLLDGSGVGGNTTPIYDTDQGELDGNSTFDAAVGLMQALPNSWASGGYTGKGDGRDGNGDGVADPNNVYDSALYAVVHLCGGSSRFNLKIGRDLDRAIYRYNQSWSYVKKVKTAIREYERMSGQ